MSDGGRACRDCGEPGALLYEALRDRHFGAEGEWSVRHCDGCDRFWLEPISQPSDLSDRSDPPDRGSLGVGYREYYTHDGVAARGFEPWLKRAVPAARLGYGDRVGAWSRLAGRVVSLFGPFRTIGERATLWLDSARRGRLLDVGCGSGELLVRMRDLGWQIAGVELDPEGARAARQRTGGAPIFSSLDEVSECDYDAVVLDHVLEHLADAPGTLRACHRALRPGGRLALATPNPTSAARERFGASWLHWDPPRHLELRGERALRQLVESCGFEVDSVFSCAGSAHFVWQASRGIEACGALPGIRTDALPLAERLAGLRFWLSEHARVARGEPCGEEWIVLASRPEPKSQGTAS